MQTLESKFIAALKDRLSAVADEALTKPSSKDAYAYGHAVGMYSGLRDALNLLDELIAKEAEEKFREPKFLP